MSIQTKTKIIRPHISIIGSGPAGLSAAIYAARAGKRVIVFGSDLGQLGLTTWVENYPGFEEPIMGPVLMQNMKKQAISVGVEFIEEMVTNLEIDKDGGFVLQTDSNKTYTSEACILATGSKAKWLGLDSETEYRGYGVSSCATCDGTFYKGQHVLVVGGGSTAVEEAIYLSQIAAEVTLIHRRDALRAEQIEQKKLFAKENVKIIWDTELQEVLGEQAVEGEETSKKQVIGALLYNNKTQEVMELKVNGIFIAIGHEPQTELVRDLLELRDGYVKSRIITKVPGLFVAGDVADHLYRQAVTAAGDGCRAALDTVRWLEGIGLPSKSSLTDSYKKTFERSERPSRDRGDRGARSDRGGYRRDDRYQQDSEHVIATGEEGSSEEGSGEGFQPREDGERAPRSFGDRPQRSFGDRPPRDGAFGGGGRGSFGDRPQRSGGFGDRPQRSFGDRPPREGGFGDRPPRAFSDRPSFGDRPQRSFGDRPQRSGGFGDRPQRSGGFGDRPSFGDRPPREGGFAPRSGGFGDRPPRSFSDRPPRAFGDRPPRTGGFGDRPSFGDRPPRSFGGGGTRGAPRSFGPKKFDRR